MSSVAILAESAHGMPCFRISGVASSSGPIRLRPQRRELTWAGEAANLPVHDDLGQRRMRALWNYYSIHRQEAVQQFIVEHAELYPVLLSAATALSKHFGQNHRTTLEVVADPESENEHELVAFVAVSLPVEDALARLDAFDRGWFLDQLDTIGGLFSVNLTYV